MWMVETHAWDNTYFHKTISAKFQLPNFTDTGGNNVT